MKFEFSNRIQGVQASAIREILKLMSDPEMIGFGGGNPASETFPVAELESISAAIFKDNPTSILQYGITEGDIQLKQEAMAFFNRHEKNTKEYDEVLITSGSQQIMDFMAKVLCNEGDTIVCENPTFLGALNSFKSNGATLVGVDLEEDGMNIEQLEKALQAKKKPKFIYVIPNFQNPTGITTSLEKRKAIYQLAKQYQVPILEDNPYGDLRFVGKRVPSIKSLDDEGLVVYAASLSKIIAPGVRVAIAIGPKELMAKCTLAKQVNDTHTNAWAQKLIANFLYQTDMDEHLAKLQGVYREKGNMMVQQIEEHFTPEVRFTKPTGGMFIWVTLPKEIDMMEFVQKALEQKVAVVPGSPFYTDDSCTCHSFRMNFSTPSIEDIQRGCKVLGDLTKQYMQK